MTPAAAGDVKVLGRPGELLQSSLNARVFSAYAQGAVYDEAEKNEVMYEEYKMEDADVCVVSFGITARVAEVLRTQYRERVRYLRGFVQSVGFQRTRIEFEAGKREHGGSHYSLFRLLSFSINTICGFSDVPLKMGIYSGLIAAACGVILIIYSIIMKACFNQPSGYTTVIVALCFLFALTLVVIGVIGEYISILVREAKQRPIYIVEECVNVEKEDE